MVMQPFMSMMQTETELPFIMQMGLLPHMNTTCSTDSFVKKTVDSEDNVVVQYTYTLGAAEERKSVTELDRTVEYSYDSLYRLTSETITEGEKVTAYTYAYDNVSNRILKNENSAATEYVYNALNQLASDSETSYEYDLNGNLVRVIGSAQSALYEYNAENKLVKATVQNLSSQNKCGIIKEQ